MTRIFERTARTKLQNRHIVKVAAVSVGSAKYNERMCVALIEKCADGSETDSWQCDRVEKDNN
jgi:hypothetical protein